MKIETYSYPHSSFLSVEKDLSIITSQVLKNERLKKLLYYTDRDALSRPNLTEEQSLELFGKNIKLVPKLYVDNSVLNYIIISLDNFTTNATNPYFRDNVIEFDIICHFDQWQMKDFELRPYRIAAEIDTLFNNQKFSGIGELQFLGSNQIILTDEFAGLCLMYSAIHADDDKKNPVNPNQEQSLNENYDLVFNDK